MNAPGSPRRRRRRRTEQCRRLPGPETERDYQIGPRSPQMADRPQRLHGQPGHAQSGSGAWPRQWLVAGWRRRQTVVALSPAGATSPVARRPGVRVAHGIAPLRPTAPLPWPDDTRSLSRAVETMSGLLLRCGCGHAALSARVRTLRRSASSHRVHQPTRHTLANLCEGDDQNPRDVVAGPQRHRNRGRGTSRQIPWLELGIRRRRAGLDHDRLAAREGLADETFAGRDDAATPGSGRPVLCCRRKRPAAAFHTYNAAASPPTAPAA